MILTAVNTFTLRRIDPIKIQSSYVNGEYATRDLPKEKKRNKTNKIGK
jgi:hypothetical protein